MTEIELQFDEDEFGRLREQVLALEAAGQLETDEVRLELQQQRGGRPNEMFVAEALIIGGAVFAVAKLLYRWWREAQPGIVIDQRPGAKQQVSRSSALPGNHVVTFAADGSAATIEVLDEGEDAIERILGKVLDVLAKPVEAVGKTIADLLKERLGGEPAKVGEGAGEADPDDAGDGEAAKGD